VSVAALARPTLRGRLAGPLASTVDFMRLMSRKRLGTIGLVGVVFFAILAYIVPFFVPVQDTVDVTAIYQLPSAAHPLGTDSSGRDVFNQIVHGGRDILTVGFIAGFFSTLIAVSFGSLAAVVGGKLDSLIAGAADFWLTIPHIPIIVLLGSILKFDSIFVIAAFLA
jgi:peptide/nickel transport system permease protein